jgi:hypothetical protein
MLIRLFKFLLRKIILVLMEQLIIVKTLLFLNINLNNVKILI